jgi:hypothetical protein
MKQVRRHHVQCHVRQLPAQHTSPEFFLTPGVSDPLKNSLFEYDDASVGTENDDVGSDYYEFKDGSSSTLDLDGIVSSDSGVDVVGESIEGRVQDSTEREDIFSIPELPSRDGDELVQADDVDLHYLPLWSTMDSPQSISGKFEKNFVGGNVVVAASVLVSQAAFQTPHLVNKILPLPNIMLFLYLAKLIISSGLLQQYNLSKVLSILYPYADKNQEDWAPYHVPFLDSGL